MSKTIKFNDVVQAIEDNGLPQCYGEYFLFSEDESNDPVAGCAIGQAARNLNTYPFRVRDALFDGVGTNIFDEIVCMNDNDKLPLKEIAKRLREKYPNLLEKRLTLGR